MIEISMHTHDYAGATNAGAESRPVMFGATIASALLIINCGSGQVTLFGPPTAVDTFDRIAVLFNEAHAVEPKSVDEAPTI